MTCETNSSTEGSLKHKSGPLDSDHNMAPGEVHPTCVHAHPVTAKCSGGALKTDHATDHLVNVMSEDMRIFCVLEEERRDPTG